ncbi:glycosyltransferase family 4 protein [Nitratidesulfovibrio liaohensis]|uniref:Glycosyltransferase family 4 protein n=1 Tax=Nitratidesulfovibrio liaohensis TaxID=2604158 RepID=A0ABY9R523_9BACT|nr:glycosyltransferase family 4 protein [Nitratidesulfovibrio liaohensis]WMW66237.1 glycosyltransferase family 4 protein [Nitratidesulfovibrio liaohensis]
MSRPKVCVFLATATLGGMGKALVQFLRTGGLDMCDPVVVAYSFGEPCETEFTSAVRESGATMACLHQRWRYDPTLVAQALRIVRESGCAMLESHGYKSHVVCACLHLLTGLPWVAFVHGWTAESWKIRAYRVLDQLVLPLATRVVAVSESLGNQLWAGARRRMVVIPNAADPEEFDGTPGRNIRKECGIPEDAVVAGVVGRLSPEKGQLHFLRALALARGRQPALQGILAGDGPDAMSLREEARRLGLNGSVHFLGHVGEPLSVYRALDMVVLPSLSEGMPLAALEAMMCSLPVVATRVGGVPEVVQDGRTGALVPAADAERLAEAVTGLADDPALRARYGEAGRERVMECFTPGRRAERIVHLYQHLTSAVRA